MEQFDRWIEVDLDRIKNNYEQIRKTVAAETKVLGVVKADAYGLGALPVAKTLEKAGIDMLAVTHLQEGKELLAGGISLPILVFSPLCKAEFADYEAELLLPTIGDLATLKEYQAYRPEQNKKFHLKVDTGMSRNGVSLAEALTLGQYLSSAQNLECAGIYSHLATAMLANKKFAQKQYQRFLELLKELKKQQISYGLVHLANSAAILSMPETHFDMVRTGTLLYGQYPAPMFKDTLVLQDPWQVKCRILSIREVGPGERIGYGLDHKVKSKMKTAVIPLGYADGFAVVPQTSVTLKKGLKNFLRDLRNHFLKKPAQVVFLKNGNKCPVVGRVGMQFSSLDVTGQQVEKGEEVKAFLRRTTASAFLPRIYKEADKTVWVRYLKNVYKESDKENKDAFF